MQQTLAKTFPLAGYAKDKFEVFFRGMGVVNRTQCQTFWLKQKIVFYVLNGSIDAYVNVISCNRINSFNVLVDQDMQDKAHVQLQVDYWALTTR